MSHAERVGFEPTEQFPVLQFSRLTQSTNSAISPNSPHWDSVWVDYRFFSIQKTCGSSLFKKGQHYWEEVCLSPLFPRCLTRAVDILRIHCLSLESKTLSISHSLRDVRDSNPWPRPWQGRIVTNSTNIPKILTHLKLLHPSLALVNKVLVELGFKFNYVW